MQKSTKFIGLIGLGYWGKNILRNLHQLGVIHSACDLDEGIIAERRAQFPDVNYTDSYKQVIDSEEIGAVVIASHAVTHYDMAKESLLSGKDVFVEKPLSLTVKEAKELVKIAEKHERVLMVGHILQYHSAVIKLKELVKSGELGKIQYAYSNRLNIGKLRVEENILWSFAPHDISVILMLLEDAPVKVTAFGGDYLNKGICDTTLTSLEFSNDVKGHIFVSWLHPYKEQKLIVIGSKAMAVFDDLSKEKLFLYRHKIEWEDGKIPVAHKADYEVVSVEEKEPLKEELKHFVNCVESRKRPKTDGYEGVKVLKVLELAEKALLYNKKERLTDSYQDFFAHESVHVDENVSVGKDSKIWHFSHILKNSIIGERCVIGQNVAVGPDVRIGKGCKLQNNVSLYKGVILEDDVFVGPSAVFTNVYNPRAFIERKSEFINTLVKRGATIGANATIVCGVIIGSYAMIGAGSVVKSDVTDHAIVAGVPAKQIGWACKCGTTLKLNDNIAVCEYCGNEYKKKNGKFEIAKVV